MRIITVSREFSSGGRELGKRLAEELGFNYFDKEIITEIAKCTELDENFVANTLEKGSSIFPVHFVRTFSTMMTVGHQGSMDVFVAQQKIIKEIAERGDCVIVGRSADVILKDKQPLNLFVYADMPSKIARCRARSKDIEKINDKELEKMIKKIDAGRQKSREFFTADKWGKKESYHLMVDTTDLSIKEITKPIAEYVKIWFAKKNV